MLFENIPPRLFLTWAIIGARLRAMILAMNLSGPFDHLRGDTSFVGSILTYRTEAEERIEYHRLP